MTVAILYVSAVRWASLRMCFISQTPTVVWMHELMSWIARCSVTCNHQHRHRALASCLLWPELQRCLITEAVRSS